MKLSGFLLFLLACPSFVYGRDVPDHNRSPHNPPSPTTPAPSAFVQAPMTPTQTPVKPANPRRSPLATPVCSAPVPISLPSCGATVTVNECYITPNFDYAAVCPCQNVGQVDFTVHFGFSGVASYFVLAVGFGAAGPVVAGSADAYEFFGGNNLSVECGDNPFAITGLDAHSNIICSQVVQVAFGV